MDITTVGSSRSAEIRRRAERLLPGGVSSPVRAFRAVGGEPPIMASAQGSHVRDEDGIDYVDMVLAYGPHILGHRPEAVQKALADQLGRGVAFGATSAPEVELAERVVAAMPGVERVRFVNSGTEAAMSAIRLARAATGRNGVVKCTGGYHGHADAFLVAAGSGVATLGIPGSPGVPAGAIHDTALVPYNDAAALADLLSRRGDEVAAFLVEPVAGNMGCVPPRPGYLAEVRRLCDAHGVLLIFDEVMTGFRIAYGGGQALYGVCPDLTCLGKVIGGGLPVAAYGGRADLMALLAPEGPVYQAGTLSGNPLAMAAGCAVLDVLASGDAYTHLEALGATLEAGFRAAAASAGVLCAVNRVGSMVTPFLGVKEVVDYEDAQRADLDRFRVVHRAWMNAGVFWPPSQFEAGFLSTEHQPADIARVLSGFATGLAG